MLAVVLSALVAGGPALQPPSSTAVRVVPDEPGAVVLPDAPTYQAVAADVDGDGTRDVVRTVAGERGAIVAEAWAETDGGWEPLAQPVEVVPARPSVGQGDVIYAGTPVRLVVRRVDGADRVTLVRQPTFQDAGVDGDCCLLLHDLVVREGSLALAAVADPGPAVGTVIAIDFDGDATDELLAWRPTEPLGGISFPMEARVYRWGADRFDPPTVSEVPIGSGDTPFVLGDSDGRPGDEAAIRTAAGRPGLFRLRLVESDAVVVDDAGVVATDALGVPGPDGRALALLGPTVGIAVVRWPAGEPLGEPIARLDFDEGDLLGAVDVDGEQRLVVRDAAPEIVHVLTLPLLDRARFTVTRSPAAAAFAASPLRPYVGPMPGGGLDGRPAVVYAGRLLPSADPPGAPFQTRGAALFATLPGAQPLGLVGRDRGWVAIQHAPLPLDRLDPGGGRLEPPVHQPGSGVSIAPVDVVRTPERDDAQLEPPLPGAPLLAGGEVAVGAGGFVARVEAPSGSRIYISAADPSVVGPVVVVPETGTVSVALPPPRAASTIYGYRAALSVVTPAGHGYVATWEVRVLGAAPELSASVVTPLGSVAVEVSGRAAPYAAVSVAGSPVDVAADGSFAARVALPPWPTPVTVVATDPVGNRTSTTLSGVGVFDYRALPWPAITVALVALVGAALFLRVPRLRARPGRADDAVLEEIEPD